MRAHGIGYDAQRRAVEYYQHTWKVQTGSMRATDLFADASEGLRAEVALKTCGTLLRQVPMFATCSDALLRMLAVRCCELYFAPGETIIRKNDMGNEMYLVRGNFGRGLTAIPFRDRLHLLSD